MRGTIYGAVDSQKIFKPTLIKYKTITVAIAGSRGKPDRVVTETINPVSKGALAGFLVYSWNWARKPSSPQSYSRRIFSVDSQRDLLP